jgi:hypothetical protein
LYDFQELEVPADVEGNDVLAAAGITGTGALATAHHLTYAVNSREEVLLAADICLENGVYIETGPHKHAI